MAARRGSDGFPNAWKIVSGLLGLLVLIGGWYATTINAQIADTSRAIAQVDKGLAQEKTDRVDAQRKTDIAVEQIKGKIEQIQRDVERIERGQNQTQEKIDKVLEELRKAGKVR